ncbi:hypothetical protein JCM19238_3118 [Vibrio ponticus]|nr:hypothetical protein JCM19238_3118 [Vibrio ponticus]
MHTLTWNDSNIPHQIALENEGQHARIEMRIVKDIEPEVIGLSVDWSLETLAEAWQARPCQFPKLMMMAISTRRYVCYLT